ncbi:hypothetical protein VTK26DRAFT_5837 [Humicola hyalothermophila]
MPDPTGGYVYVPYLNDGKDNLPADLVERIKQFEAFMSDPVNLQLIQEADGLMEAEVNEKCFWEFLDGGNASQIDFHGKIKMLARYRLMRDGIDVSPNDPTDPMFHFVIVNMDQFGRSDMKWCRLEWGGHYEEIVDRLEESTRLSFTYDEILPKMIWELNNIQEDEAAKKEAKALIARLQTERPDRPNDTKWMYFLCNKDENLRKLEEKRWVPLETANDFKMMRRRARELGRWPVIVRPWHYRHHENCNRTRLLQKRQIDYCRSLHQKRREEDRAKRTCPEAEQGEEGMGKHNVAGEDSDEGDSVPDLLDALANGDVNIQDQQTPFTPVSSGADGGDGQIGQGGC